MNGIESIYRLLTIIVSYQCCLGAPPSNYEITLPSVHVMGVDNTFTGVKLRKSSCQFDVIFPQSKPVTDTQFTPTNAEIMFLYKKRIVFGVYKGANSSTVYGLNFDRESSLQLFFWSLCYYQPKPESFIFAAAILRYSLNAPNDVQVMTQGCDFHVQKFYKPGFNWKSFNFTKVTDNSQGTREGILTFIPKTFSVSKPLGRTKFSLCHYDTEISDEVFIVIFNNPSSGKRFSNKVEDEQHLHKLNSCEFPNLNEVKKKKIEELQIQGRRMIEASDLE